ncbi:VOC family protein [Solitalea canadensis]|uniref:Lactoylglutathione lyase-like lyase n=1 Tax=Solitalea canadensis (strain ATCC 29591 / DSM 3403 / JCM 21819 / LMG 8368 / NBRC 15130 / NCIMB 12057 / USAM 9D) TaxID=929556 RepID=H8KTP3_SOLCM|nr:VOC family protein [Solitalea canadensis]AFD06618.1 lactoylglutathione lyase-like lyase [Solitalea canadensis DSM 3403]
MKLFQFILYVADQNRSTDFYRTLLDQEPLLEVPGMTEFELAPSLKLGIMPENGIAKIISEKVPHPANGNGIPRCEIYLVVDDLLPYYERAKQLNAILVSDISFRDWGHKACYFADPDGHIVAFAEELY